MTKQLLALPLVSALTLLVALPAAQAADMPIKAPVYKSQPYYAPSWTGFYLGVNAGYGFGKQDVTLAPTSASFGPVFAAGGVPNSATLDSKGFLAGLQLGYNYQFGSSWLMGIEADLQYSTIKGSSLVSLPGVGLFVPSNTTVDHKIDWFGTARLRAGYIAMDSLLLYGTGGLAVGHVKDSASIAFPSLAQLYSGSSTATKIGWTAGGGAEWAFSQKWTTKAEYLYYDLGSNTVDMSVVTGPAGTASATIKAKGHIGRVGLNYRF